MKATLFSLTAIFLAAGVTIGAVIGVLTSALKASGNAIGKGLKDIGSTVGSTLPGLIYSIVSFLYKKAGQVVSYLAKHTLLFILTVVVLIVEKQPKKSGVNIVAP